jgi:hypothetical protein
MGQTAHCVCDNGEAAAPVASPCSFNGRIQSQYVCLKSNNDATLGLARRSDAPSRTASSYWQRIVAQISV